MQEEWIQLMDYPGYAVSTEGRVTNTKTDLVKHPSQNQQGIAIVNMKVHGKQCVRSVARLVADAFIDRYELPPHFDTPIHLNGDKMDCRVVNMAFRPRWFAIKYHQQFLPHERANRYGFRTPVELIETGEVFPTSWEAAIKYGMLDREIFLATANRTYVFPHHFTFREVEE